MCIHRHSLLSFTNFLNKVRQALYSHSTHYKADVRRLQGLALMNSEQQKENNPDLSFGAQNFPLYQPTYVPTTLSMCCHGYGGILTEQQSPLSNF